MYQETLAFMAHNASSEIVGKCSFDINLGYVVLNYSDCDLRFETVDLLEKADRNQLKVYHVSEYSLQLRWDWYDDELPDTKISLKVSIVPLEKGIGVFRLSPIFCVSSQTEEHRVRTLKKESFSKKIRA